MSYGDIIEDKDVFDEGFMVIMSPRRPVLTASFSVYAGAVSVASFDYGYVSAVEIDGEPMTLGTGTGISAGQFYFDAAANRLYLRTSELSDFNIVTYEICLATKDFAWHRIPTDTTSAEAAFEPYLLNIPSVKQDLSDTLYGVSPITVSNMLVDNREHFLERHLDSSFSRATVKGYHWVDELTEDNVELFLEGFLDRVSYSQTQVSFAVRDITEIFSEEFRSTEDGYSDFYSYVDGIVEPSMLGRPKRRVFGTVKSMQLTNCNFSENLDHSITDDTINNRWAVCRSEDAWPVTTLLPGLDDIRARITPGSNVSSGGKTYGVITFSDTAYRSGLNVGEYLLIQPSGYSFSNPPTQSELDSHSTRIDGIVSPGNGYLLYPARTIASDTKVWRCQVPFVTIEVNDSGSTYGVNLPAFRGYYPYIDSGLLKLQFLSGFSALTYPGFSGPLDQGARVMAQVYGKFSTGKNDADKTVTYPATDPITGAVPDAKKYPPLMNGVRILYEILANDMGLPTSELDTATFDALEISIEDRVGFAVPELRGNDYPTYKEVIDKLLLTLGCRLFRNDDDKWTIRQIEAISAPVDEMVDDDIVQETVQTEYNYADVLSDVLIQFTPNSEEYVIPWEEPLWIRNFGFGPGPSGTPDGYTIWSWTKDPVAAVSNEKAKFLHKSNRQKKLESYHFDSFGAARLAQIICEYYSERQALTTLRLSKKFLNSLIGDEVTVTREKLPGFSYEDGVLHSRNGVIIGITKSPRAIEVVIDDQKGIEDA